MMADDHCAVLPGAETDHKRFVTAAVAADAHGVDTSSEAVTNVVLARPIPFEPGNDVPASVSAENGSLRLVCESLPPP